VVAVFAAILALAGAPATTPVTCQPPIPNEVGYTLGNTFWPDGAPSIVLKGQPACLAAYYVASTPLQRKNLERLNPQAWDRVAGLGLLVILHESEHAALGRAAGECLVQRTAMSKMPLLLHRFVPWMEKDAWWWTRASDRQFRAANHCP
jgi:hypothetical protein